MPPPGSSKLAEDRRAEARSLTRHSAQPWIGRPSAGPPQGLRKRPWRSMEGAIRSSLSKSAVACALVEEPVLVERRTVFGRRVAAYPRSGATQPWLRDHPPKER
jgi:hypothetical protein